MCFGTLFVGSDGGHKAPTSVIEEYRPAEEPEEFAEQHEEPTLDRRDAIEA